MSERDIGRADEIGHAKGRAPRSLAVLGVLGVLGAMVAMAALVFANWVSREVDSLRSDVRDARETVARQAASLDLLSASLDGVFESARATDGKVENLIGELAREDALGRGPGALAWQELEAILPDVLRDVVLPGPMRDGIRFTQFLGEPRLFVAQETFERLSASDQAAILDVLPAAGVRVEIVEGAFRRPVSLRSADTGAGEGWSPALHGRSDESVRGGFRERASQSRRFRQVGPDAPTGNGRR